MADDRLTSQQPGTGMPSKPLPQRRLRSLVGVGAVFAVTFAATAAFAWAILPKRTPQQPPAKGTSQQPPAREEPKVENILPRREERLPDKVEPVSPKREERETPRLKAGEVPAVAVFTKCSPAVVQVIIHDIQDDTKVTGSGFLISTSGLVATNYHVVKKGQKAHVVFPDRIQLPVLGVAAFDQEADIAILKVADQTDTQPLELAEDELPPVGSRVYAIGSPLGHFTNTLSDGLVSAHRGRGTVPYFPRMPTMIQMTVPISHGSSGGPLLRADGKVVGVTTLGFAHEGGQNLNLAVPVSHVLRLLRGCDGSERLTPFPLNRPPLVEAPTLARPWTEEEVENAAHFVRAMQAANGALQLCKQAGHEGRPWLLIDTDRIRFCQLMGKANGEARLVRPGVLRRMHPGLPDGFSDLIIATNHVRSGGGSVQDRSIIAAWNRWMRWWATHASDVYVPKEALRLQP
jgi:S1-C subfamily serine protease